MAQYINNVMKLLIPRAHFYNRHRILLYSAYNKDLVKPSIPVAPDILLQNLKQARTVSSILEMVGTHKKIMNSKHILQALRTVFALQKQGDADMSVQQVLRHPNFEALCRSLKSNAGIIDINETIEALKVVFYLGVKADSTIVQVLLQLIRHNLNQLSLKHIMFLDFLLAHRSSSPLMEALKMALPLVFEIHCHKKMDRENIVHLADYLHYASKNNISEECIKDISSAFLNCKEPLDLTTAKSIVWSVTDLPPYEFLEPLLSKGLNVLTSELTEMSFIEMETTFTKVLQRVTRKNAFYDETFVEACISCTIDKDVDYTKALHVARKLTRVGHYNRYILDHIATQVYEYPNLVVKGDPLETYILVNCIALTDDRPVYWDEIKEAIEMVNNITHNDRKEILWVKYACSLSLLGIFREDVLERVLQEDVLLQTLKKSTRDIINYLSLCQNIKLHRPDMMHMIPNTLKPEDVIRYLRKPTEFPLDSSLHMAFGGENYVHTNLMSRVGSLIDHVIVFRSGGYPVALNSNGVEFIEDLIVGKDQQMVIVIGLAENDLTINTRNFKGTTSSRIRSLEAEGYPVVPIDLDMWNALPDFEKIPYLVQYIKTKSTIDFTVSADVG